MPPRASLLLAIVLAAPMVASVPACARTRIGPNKPDYFPVAMGHRWEFRVTNAGKEPVIGTCEVVAIESHDGKITASLEMKYPNRLGIGEEVSVDAKGVYRCSFPGARLPRPITMLRYPILARESWTEATRLAGEDVELTTRVLATAEEVVVPAGRFTAVAVEVTFQSPTQHAVTTSWYVDGIGLVKQIVSTGGRTTMTMELLSFDLGQ